MARLLAIVCVVLLAATAAAGPRLNASPQLVGGLGAAKADTVTVYGGPGTLEGKFQTTGGLPDPQGWVGVDRSEQTTSLWQITDFLAGDFPPARPDNHVWWCGETFADDCNTGDFTGYGNNLNQHLAYRLTAPDPASPTTVRVTSQRKQDTEPGYDYLILERETPSGWVQIEEWTGTTTGVVGVDQTVVVPPSDYVGPGGDEIALRWTARSDGAWSDADCLWPTLGHSRLDRIEVFLDGVSQGVETCEPGDPQLWAPDLGVSVGDFSQVWPLLADIDPCVDNDTPQWAFIDDGVVVPCTGGTVGTIWTYGPGGFVVNTTGGCSDDPDALLNNAIWSPVIAIDPDLEATRLSFDLYSHLPVLGEGNTITYWTWHVRSSADGGVTWDMWRTNEWIHFGRPEYDRIERDLSIWLLPGADRIQVSLGVGQFTFGFSPPYDATPAPYFDNVRVQQWDHDGPHLSASPLHLARDAFPAAGAVDPQDPGAASVRFDMALDIAGTTSPAIVHGDSIVVRVEPLRAGAQFEAVDLHYVMHRNTVFDPWRTAGLPDAGSVYGQMCQSAPGVYLPDRWCFDLPDEGFLFPGDQLHYYISATTSLGGDPLTRATSTLPADLSQLGVFPDVTHGIPWPGRPDGLHYRDEIYPHEFTVNALPRVESLEPYEQREHLVWIDCDATDVLQMLTRITEDAYLSVPAYDVFVTHSPASGAGNGLGACATPEQIDGYRNLIYLSGAQTENTLTGPGFVNGQGTSNSGDKGDDIGLLNAWLQGDRGLFATGDHLLTDLENEPTGAGALFVSNVLGVNVLGDDVGEIVGQPSPWCRTTWDLPFNTEWTFHLDGACPDARTFDAVMATAGLTSRVMEILDADAQPAFPYGALFKRGTWQDPQRLIFGPAALSAWTVDGDEVSADPLLADVLSWLDMLRIQVPGAGDDIAPTPFYARTHPNPFNPQVTIDFGMPRAGAAKIVIHDVRGRTVRTLVDGELPAGPQTATWDGRDGEGRSLSSGVYFAIVEAVGERAVRKLALVR